MMKLKVHGGTAREGEAALCLSCRYASSISGASAHHTLVRCAQLHTPITFKVTTCTDYLSKQPSLYHMEDIAWVLRTDAKHGQMGFVRGKDLKPRERFVLDDE